MLGAILLEQVIRQLYSRLSLNDNSLPAASKSRQ